MKNNFSLGSVDTTARGFEIIRFADGYEHPCSLQASSLAVYEKPGTSAIWIGTEDAKPLVMWKDAAAVGVKTDAMSGWVPFPIPLEVQLSTRAHMTREQVIALIGHLQRWLKNGSFV